MFLDLIQSEMVRLLFSEDYDKTLKISDPNKSLGQFANEAALDTYYKRLNILIKESNSFEMFEDVHKKDDFNAKKKMYMLEFVALCNQMIDRDIIYPTTEEEISDFTQDILIEASEVTNEYKDDNNKSLKKIIYL